LVGPLPTVRVIDSNGNGVPAISVRFTAADGSIAGNASEVVATDASGHASASDWTLSADAGANAMSAQVDGLAGLPTLQVTATGTGEADIAVSKTSEQASAAPGQVVDYLISVSNAGPSNAQQVEVLDLLPAELDLLSAAWVCMGEAGASCDVETGDGD